MPVVLAKACIQGGSFLPSFLPSKHANISPSEGLREPRACFPTFSDVGEIHATYQPQTILPIQNDFALHCVLYVLLVGYDASSRPAAGHRLEW